MAKKCSVQDGAEQVSNEKKPLTAEEIQNIFNQLHYENSKLKEQLQEFEKIRYEVQVELMQTGKNNEEKYKKMQDSYSELIQDAEAKRFFEAETKFNILIADVNKIIGEAISDVI